MTKYETDKKTGDVNKLVKKAYYNPKITEKEGKIPSNTGQATTIALNSVENKIFNVSGLVKKKQILMQKHQILTLRFCTTSD